MFVFFLVSRGFLGFSVFFSWFFKFFPLVFFCLWTFLRLSKGFAKVFSCQLWGVDAVRNCFGVDLCMIFVAQRRVKKRMNGLVFCFCFN